MSDTPQGAGWWQATDGRWYPPEQWTGAGAPRPDQTAGGAGWWSSLDGTWHPPEPIPEPVESMGSTESIDDNVAQMQRALAMAMACRSGDSELVAQVWAQGDDGPDAIGEFVVGQAKLFLWAVEALANERGTSAEVVLDALCQALGFLPDEHLTS